MLKSFSGSYEDVEERIKYYLNESESRTLGALTPRPFHTQPTLTWTHSSARGCTLTPCSLHNPHADIPTRTPSPRPGRI